MALVPWLLCAILGAVSCHDVGCPAPRSPENGLSFIFNRGRLVRYRCHPGFTLRGHSQAVCHHNSWNRPAPVCLISRNDATRRGAKLPHRGEDSHGDRQPFEWDSTHKEDDSPLTNGKRKKSRQHIFSVSGSSKQAIEGTELVNDHVAEMRHRYEEDVRGDRRNDGESNTANEGNEVPALELRQLENQSVSHHNVMTSADSSLPSKKRKEHHRYSASGPAYGRQTSLGQASFTSTEQGVRDDNGTPTDSSGTSFAAADSAPREAMRKQSHISDHWKSLPGEHTAEMQGKGPGSDKKEKRAFKRSYLHSDDDYDLEEDDEDDDDTQYRSTHRGDLSPIDDEEEQGNNRFPPRTVTFERGPKGDREPYDPNPGVSRSSSVDYFGRPVQVLTGEKAHQQDALLRRQYEMAQQHRRASLEEFRAREEVRFEPPPRNTPVTSRPIDYFGRPVQVHTGEKAAQAEALLKRQYEIVQQRMRDNQFQEARKRPDAEYFPRQGVSEDDRPVRHRGDREPLPPPGHLVTSRPVDYFGRPVQVLTGDKAAQAEAMLRRQYEEYQARLNRRPSEPDYAVGRPVEFNRRPVQPGPVSSPPFDHFGRPVQVLTGEKAGQQTELLRQQYDMAHRSGTLQEARSRPTEEVHHRHRHQHGEQGTSGALRLSRQDLELMSRLSPELRASFLRDLRQARIKEETDPERASEFLSRYRNLRHTKAVQADSTTAIPSDEVDDEMLGDQPSQLVPLTTVSTEDTSSESSENASIKHSSSKATYDQSCLQDRKRGRSFLSAPKVKHAYVYKYERKVLSKPPQTTHYVLARYKCLLGYRLKYAKANALYCRQRQWIGEHPTCVRS